MANYLDAAWAIVVVDLMPDEAVELYAAVELSLPGTEYCRRHRLRALPIPDPATGSNPITVQLVVLAPVAATSNVVSAACQGRT